ncbi:MAG TPA: hypothetical protein VEA19_03385, partial [Actinomycetota bacterium]|nr:hypothetical protein [Actinomycetota bacterium]
GQPATSLVISAGSTTDETFEDPGAGVATASAGQKNVLTISTRDDLTGGVALEPSLTSMGSLNLTVSYLDHEHT